MQKVTPRTWILIVVALMAMAVAILSFRATAADAVITVSGNTSGGENQPGWLFNYALGDGAPYVFNFEEKHQLGQGSLKVGPLSATNMFNAYLYPGSLPAATFISFSYDYKFGSDRNVSDAQFVTVSVFANTPNNVTCRFDYTAQGASNSGFVKQEVNAGMPANPSDTRDVSCGEAIGQLPADSQISAIAITVGTDSADDTGLVAYIDGVELTTMSDSTLYNFEPAPRTQADCADKKWQQYQFRNQGQCLKAVDKNSR